MQDEGEKRRDQSFSIQQSLVALEGVDVQVAGTFLHISKA